MPNSTLLSKLSNSSQQLLTSGWGGATVVSPSQTSTDSQPQITDTNSASELISDPAKTTPANDATLQTPDPAVAPPVEELLPQAPTELPAVQPELPQVQESTTAEPTQTEQTALEGSQIMDVVADEQSAQDLASLDQVSPSFDSQDTERRGEEIANQTASEEDEDEDEEKMKLFEAALDQAEQFSPPTPVEAVAEFAVVPQALPQATEDAWQASQAGVQAAAVAGSKERTAGSWSLDAAVAEAGGGLATVEQEPTPELSPEVESYLKKVEDQHSTPAEEVANMAPAAPAPPSPTIKQTVRVLPITKEQEEKGKKKNPSYGIRWLVEFSKKLAMMFKDKVIYRSAQA